MNEVLIKLLDYCEMHCVMCGQLSDTRRGHILPAEILRRYFSEKTLSNTRVYLWGGEPLLHPELESIIRFFKTRGATVAINTNGYRMEHIASALVDAGMDRIIFSLDGLDSKTHDSVRGYPGAHEQVIKNLRLILNLRGQNGSPLIRINFVVLPINYEQIPRVVDWAKNEGVYKVHFQLPMFLHEIQLKKYAAFVAEYYGHGIRNYRAFVQSFSKIDYQLLSDIMALVRKQHSDIAQFYPYQYLAPDELHQYFETPNTLTNCFCNMSEGRIAIDTSGQIVLCPDFPDIVSEEGLDNPAFAPQSQQVNVRGKLSICNRCCHYVPIPEKS
jgi:MoaA/NifB/PqqE/SkfB family radical SAM enzyme